MTLGGRRYRLPPLHLSKLALASTDIANYELELTEVYRYLLSLRPDGAFIDVGANVGQTLLKLLSIDPARQYIGIEPQASGCSEILSFIRSNSLPNHRIVCCGLADSAGMAHMRYELMDDVRANIVPELRPRELLPRTQAIAITTGDILFEHLGIHNIAVIKIDVEGGELEVLQGMEQTLQLSNPFIVFEVLPDKVVSTGRTLDPSIVAVRRSRYEAITQLLTNAGYGLALVNVKGGLVDVNSIAADPNGTVRNYLASPKGLCRDL